MKRTAGGKTEKLDNTEVTFNMFYDLGAVYSFNVNEYISLCAAPAASLMFANSEYHKFNSLSNVRATIDSVFGVGVTCDIYAKLRYKYFVAAAGCAGSFYPLCMVISSDSAINYSSNIRDTMAYNLRPYISIGITFKEHTALNIKPSN